MTTKLAKSPIRSSTREGAGDERRIKGEKSAGPLAACRLIDIGGVRGPRGDLAFIEAGLHVPFEIRRVFYIDKVPHGVPRAGHALKTCEQFIIALSGAFDVTADDGATCSRWHLDSSSKGLYLAPMVWREVENFSPGAICLVLASEHFSDAAYIRSYDEFQSELGRQP